MIKIKNLCFYESTAEAIDNPLTGQLEIQVVGLFDDQHQKFKEAYQDKLQSGVNYYIIRIVPIKQEPDYWITSDLHLGHERVLTYDPRPFKNTHEHDATILKNIIEVVKPGDHLYILGDTFFYDKKTWGLADYWLSQIPCQKFFIKGNHDYKETIALYEKCGIYLGEQKRINILGDDIVLNHFPLRTWNRSHYGSYHLYGHHHGDIDINPYGRSMDAWIGTKNYYPLNWVKDIKPILSQRELHYVQGDHHNQLTNP